MTNGETSPSQETRRPRKTAYVRALAGLALVGLLAGCAVVGQDRLANARHAPNDAPYSRDANPEYYRDLASVPRTSESAGGLDMLKKQAVAEWLPTETDKAVSAIRAAITKTRSDATIPIFVSYAIPNRDLSGHSAGGLAEDEYRAYITSLSHAIGDTPAIVIVEPDALAQLPDIKTAAERTERIDLLASAVDTFYHNPKTAVYLDAGNSNWRSSGQTAGLLKDIAGKSDHGVPGISLNVSNFLPEADARRYAADVSKQYGRTLYTMIDNSRNGAIPSSGDFCNPPGARIGAADASFTRSAKVETAFIKTPGESDGTCGISQETAGTFSADLLLAQLGILKP